MDFDGDALRWPLYVALSARGAEPPQAGGDPTHIDGEIRNGGFTQLLYNNHARGLSEDARAEALAAVGAAAAAGLARQAARRLARDEGERALLLARGPFEAPPALDRDLAALSRRWVGLEPSVLRLLGGWLNERRDEPALVAFIAEAGVKASGTEGGSTPLHAAALDGDLARVRRLLAKGADPGAVDAAGHTPLIEALMDTGGTKDRLAVVRALVEAGASLSARDRFGQGVLRLCASDPVRVKALVALGASPDERSDGETPLHRCGHPEVVRILVAAGAQVDALDDWGCTPLLRQLNSASGRTGKPDLRVHESLLAAGADPAWVDAKGRDAFSHAADNLDLLSWLQKKGLRPVTVCDDRGLEGETALHQAAANGWTPVVKRLLKLGAPVNARLRAVSTWLRGHAGATPLDLARSAGHKACAAALEAAGGVPGAPLGHGVVLLAKREGGVALEALLEARVGDAAALLRGVPTNEGDFFDANHELVVPAVVTEGMSREAADELAGAIAAAGGVALVL